MNIITIKFGTKLNSTKHIVVNYNFTPLYRGGVRIPMSDLLTNLLCHFKVCLDQCIPNVFWIVSSVNTLNKRLRLKLTEHDINYVYSFHDNKTSRYYFKIQHGEVRLISGLLDSDKETKGDYLIILGNW